MMSRLATTALLALLVGCAFNSDEGATARDNRAAHELDDARANLSVIVGKWHGQLIRQSSTLSLEAEISGLPVDTGTRDSNGHQIYRLDTTVYLTSPDDPVRFTGSFKGAFFIQSTSYQIVVSNPSAQVGDDLRTLQLNIAGSKLIGPLQSLNGQLLGRVELERVTGGQNGGDDRDEEDRRNEIERQVLSRIAGAYYGPVTMNTPVSGACQKYNVCVEINMQQERTPRGGWKYSLKGRYYREDFTPGNFIGERNVSVDYNYRSKPESLAVTSKGVAAQPYPSPFIVTIIGNFAVDQRGNADQSLLNGTQEIENLGQFGSAVLRHVKQCPARPAQGRCLSR